VLLRVHIAVLPDRIVRPLPLRVQAARPVHSAVAAVPAAIRAAVAAVAVAAAAVHPAVAAVAEDN